MDRARAAFIDLGHDGMINLYHKLILPIDANHRNTLYAGSLLRIALEAAYATAHLHVGNDANLALMRVVNLECKIPVPVGSVIEIQSAVLSQTVASVVVGMYGTPLPNSKSWMDGIMIFAQIDETGRSTAREELRELTPLPHLPHWVELYERYCRSIKKPKKTFAGK
jgi:acyl-CoA thioesterase YciA